jgi:hypothetical protein
VTPAAFVFAKYLNGSDIQPVEEYLGPVREGGDGLDERFDIQVAHRARGTLVVHARPDITGMCFSAFFGGGLSGNPASAWALASNPATHTFQFPLGGRTTYYTMIIQHPGGTLTQAMQDARCVGLNVTSQNRAPVILNTSWIGRQIGASYTVALTPAYETGDVFGFWNASVTFPFAGSAASYISQYAVDAQIAVDESLFTQGLTLVDIVDLTRSVTIQMDEVYQNASNYLFVEFKGGPVPTYTLATAMFKVCHAITPGGSARSFSLEANLVRMGDTQLTPIDPENKSVYAQHAGIAFAGATSSLVAFVANAHASNYLA